MKTGAVHSCQLFFDNNYSYFFEDIGRHNAVDKIIGLSLIKNLDLSEAILMTSGRISSEMLIKVAKIKIPILISSAAPTALAIEKAREINMTLIGFARGERFNIYSGKNRVQMI